MYDEAEVVRVPTPWEQFLRWAGPPRGYQLTRWLILRLLGFVYVFAFLGLIFQGPALLGSHGLTPVATYIDLIKGDGATFWDLPSLFMWGASDTALMVWAYVGLALAIACLLGYANLPSLLALNAPYRSLEPPPKSSLGPDSLIPKSPMSLEKPALLTVPSTSTSKARMTSLAPYSPPQWTNSCSASATSLSPLTTRLLS